MANTVIQLKHSTLTGNVPSSLANGEISINSRDGKFFYSTPAGVVTTHYPYLGPAGLDTEIQFNDSGTIGGSDKLTFNKTTGQLTVNGTVRANIFSADGVNIYNYAGLAYLQANTPSYVANSAATYANSAFIAANAAFAAANSDLYSQATANAAFLQANSAFTVANAAFTSSNGSIAWSTANSAASYANSAFVAANTPSNVSNSAALYANSGFSTANSAGIYANSAFLKANTPDYVANSAASYANSAFARANNSLDANNGGTVTGTITANSFITTGSFGNITGANTIYANNFVANTGFIQFADGSKQFTANAAVTDPSAGTYANAGFAVANSSASYANSAFLSANNGVGVDLTQNTNITNAGTYANAAFSVANSAFTSANGTIVWNTANAAFIQANTPSYVANSAAAYANGAFAAANAATATDTTQNTSITAAFLQANTPSYTANSAAAYANGAFVRANNSLNANAGGTVSGDVIITGNLTIQGTSFTANAGILTSNDTMFILGINNYTADVLDLGFAAHYNAGTNAHSGLIRDSTTKEWYLFKGYTPEIGANNNIDINDASFAIDTLSANLKSTSITLKGVDLLGQVNNAYLAANTPSYTANSAAAYANGAFTTANNALTSTNGVIAWATANSAASYANSGFAVSNSAASYANAGFSLANGHSAIANSAAIYANGAFTKANNALPNATGTFAGTLSVTETFKSLQSIGDEGGQIDLATAATNQSLSGGTISIDVFQNKLRIFEAGGTNRGVYIDLANGASASVGTNLLAPSNSTDGWARGQANASFATANSAASYANAAFAQANTGSGSVSAGSYANSAFSKANSACTAAATAQSTASSAAGAAAAAQSTADSAYNTNDFAVIYTPNNSTSATASSRRDTLNIVGESGVVAYANSSTKTITIAGTPGAQGLTVDYGYVADPLYYAIDYGTL